MKNMLMAFTLLCLADMLSAQDYGEDLQDCNYEKDVVFIDWDNELNGQYAERKNVERLNRKKLRSFYCQNLIARDRMELDGQVVSKGGFRFSEDKKNYLIFGIKMGDIIYRDKLFIHIGARQKLVLSED